MYKQGFLTKIKKPEWRWVKWQSNVKPLVTIVENIKKQEKINLTELDKEVLFNRLNAKYFRIISYNTIKNHIKKENNINSVDEILGFFEMLIILMEQNKEYIQECLKITNKKQYEKLILDKEKDSKILQNKIKLKKFSDKIKDEEIPTFHKKLEKELNKKIPYKKLKDLIQEFRESKQLSLLNPEIYENAEVNLGSKEAVIDLFINSFITPIPKNLFLNYRGISSFGRKYLEIEKYIEEIWKFRAIQILEQIDDTDT
jgi:glutamyl/glutaminyl-tRNA synthetase